MLSPGAMLATSCPLSLSTTVTVTVFSELASFSIPSTVPLSFTLYSYVPASVYVMSPKLAVPPLESGFVIVVVSGIGAPFLPSSVNVNALLMSKVFAPVPVSDFFTGILIVASLAEYELVNSGVALILAISNSFLSEAFSTFTSISLVVLSYVHPPAVVVVFSRTLNTYVPSLLNLTLPKETYSWPPAAILVVEELCAVSVVIALPSASVTPSVSPLSPSRLNSNSKFSIASLPVTFFKILSSLLTALGGIRVLVPTSVPMSSRLISSGLVRFFTTLVALFTSIGCCVFELKL